MGDPIKHELARKDAQIPCECTHGHQLMDYRCPVNAIKVYVEAVVEDEEWIKNHTKTDIIKAKQKQNYFLRRVAYKANKYQNGKRGDERTEKYFMFNRIGRDKINEFGKQLNDELGLSVFQKNNKFALSNNNKKTFTGHSLRRTAIRNMEQRHGDKLTEEEKLSLSGHKRSITWDHYADRGDIKKQRTMEKVAHLNRKWIGNNNNTSNTSNTSIISSSSSSYTSKTKIISNNNHNHNHSKMDKISNSINTTTNYMVNNHCKPLHFLSNQELLSLNYGPKRWSPDYDFSGNLKKGVNESDVRIYKLN